MRSSAPLPRVASCRRCQTPTHCCRRRAVSAGTLGGAPVASASAGKAQTKQSNIPSLLYMRLSTARVCAAARPRSRLAACAACAVCTAETNLVACEVLPQARTSCRRVLSAPQRWQGNVSAVWWCTPGSSTPSSCRCTASRCAAALSKLHPPLHCTPMRPVIVGRTSLPRTPIARRRSGRLAGTSPSGTACDESTRPFSAKSHKAPACTSAWA